MPRSDRSAVRVPARAKVNLFLEITGRRADGYHTLSTVFQEIDWADEVAARPRADGEVRLRVAGGDAPAGPENLVLRAAEAFRRVTGWAGGADLRLAKRLPMGAGLGGGSSDAAAAFKALWRLYRPSRAFPAERFHAAAKALGADVPFFLKGGLARAGGIGDKLTPLPGAVGCGFVVIFPRVHVSTPWVYKQLRLPLTTRRLRSRILRDAAAGRPVDWAGLLFNRLEDVVLPRVPAVRRAKKALLSAGCRAALMSGSGSSVFGVTDDPASAGKIARSLRGGDWDVRAAAGRAGDKPSI